MSSDRDRITPLAGMEASAPGYGPAEGRHGPAALASREPEAAADKGAAHSNGPLLMAKSGFEQVKAWVSANAFTPEWLPPMWRRWWVGYGAALLGQIAVTAFTLALVTAFPAWRYPGAIQLLVTVLIALAFGTGPSVVAAIFGAFLVYYVVAPPHFSLIPVAASDLLGALLYACVGVTISVLPSQVERARRAAERARADATRRNERLNATFDAMVDGVFVYDASGRVIQSNATAQAFLARSEERRVGKECRSRWSPYH